MASVNVCQMAWQTFLSVACGSYLVLETLDTPMYVRFLLIFSPVLHDLFS